MGALCFCCVGEGGQIDRVMDRFPLIALSKAKIGFVVKAVGHVLPDQLSGALVGPVTGRPCVFYHIIITEKWVERSMVNNQVQERKRSRTVVNEKRSVDFWICDGTSRAFVRGSLLANIRIRTVNVRKGGVPSAAQAYYNRGAFGGGANPYGRNAYNRRGQPMYMGAPPVASLGFSRIPGRQYESEEKVIEVNEKVSVLGHLVDQKASQGALPTMIPLSKQAITGEYMEKNEWTDWDKRSWAALTKRSPVVFVSNRDRGVKMVPVRMPPPPQLTAQQHPPPSHQQQQQQRRVESKEVKLGNIVVIPRDKITMGNELGRGNFGVAYRATYNGGTVVVKVPKVATEADFQEMASFAQITNHPNVLTLVGMTDIDGKMSFVTEFCALGSLDRLHNRKDLNMHTESVFLRIAGDVGRGLTHLHKLGIVQRDIACRHLLMDHAGKVLIADWGLSRRLNNGVYQQNNSAVAWPWAAPESLKTGRFTQKTDIWMLGVTFFEILSQGKDPYDWRNCDRRIASRNIVEGNLKLDVPTGAPYLPGQIMTACLAFKARERPTAEQVVMAVQQRTVTVLQISKSSYANIGDLEQTGYAIPEDITYQNEQRQKEGPEAPLLEKQ